MKTPLLRLVRRHVRESFGAYTPAGQVEDADTSATTVGDVTGTRYYTCGGATVAVRTHDGKLALVLGDEQGSVSVTMPVTLNPDGTMASATEADAQAVTRTSYTPYGQLRGADNLALDRGWLGQVEDRADEVREILEKLLEAA